MIKSKCQSAIKVLNAYGSLIAVFEENDCFVYALGCAFDLPYYRAHKIARLKFNRRSCYGIKSIIAYQFFREMFKNNLYTINNKTILNIIIRPMVKKESKGETKEQLYNVAQFANTYSVGTYLVFVNYHCLVIKDGTIIDTRKTFSLRCKVKRAFKIGKKEVAQINEVSTCRMAA